MKKVSAFILAMCILFSFIMPLQVFAAHDGSVGISSQYGTSCPNIIGTSGQSGDISAFSGWEGGDSEFFTRIRLTVTDRGGNSLEGVVYGLYLVGSDYLIQYLTTDSSGIATSDDVPVGSVYYLVEYAGPEGFLPNTDSKHVDLTATCTPSRVDEKVVYDPITGYIKVIKTDEDGNPLSNVGFYVYREDTWQLVDTIYTDENGQATTALLPYGWYVIYEFDVPENMAASGYSYVQVVNDGAIHQIEIINNFARGNLQIFKKGNDDRKIEGAVFSIYKVDGDEWIEDITTNRNGYAFSSAMLLGEYYVVEKSVPSPYVLNTDKHYFTIAYSDQFVYLDIVNNVGGDEGKIKVIKTDDSIEPVVLDGVVFGVYRSWDNKKITEMTTQSDGTAECTLIPGAYYLLELSGKPGYTMVAEQVPFTIDGTGATVKKTVVNPRIRIFGKVKVVKTDDAGTPIPNVHFGVYCPSGNLLEEMVTGIDGTATSGVLNEGTGYYLTELSNVIGHLTDTVTQYPFAIAENGAIVPVHVTNPRITGKVKVIKDDGKGNPLAGVVFGLYKNGVLLAELTTAEDGTATSDVLYYGSDYELRELSTVAGYQLVDTPIPFSILEQDVVVEIPVSNSLILGSVTILKVDAEDVDNGSMTAVTTDSPLAGAVFGLYNQKDQKIAELTIDRTGQATYEGLPKSGYWIKELVAPEGFAATDEVIPFEINQQGEQVKLIVPNKRGLGTIKIVKHGEGERLPDVVFAIYRSSTNQKIMELTTGRNGQASQTLPLGHYYLRELSTASGYSLLTGSVSFTLTAQGATVELPIQNQKEPAPDGGKIKLMKRSTVDGSMLSGAVFGLYRAVDNVKLGELITDSTGVAFSDTLSETQEGYYLMELAAPANFKLATDKIPVTVKNGMTVEVTVHNEPDTTVDNFGRLMVVKNDVDSGIGLKGATFDVYRASDNERIAQITTDKYGEAVLSLPAGEFYLRETKAPNNYRLDSSILPFTIRPTETVIIRVTNRLIRSYSPNQDSDDFSSEVKIVSADSTFVPLELEPILLPQTGEAYPIRSYVVAGACFMFAAGCYWFVCRKGNKVS